ncbi:DUF2975 domain-containing protein [Sphingomonas sp. RS2018]
MTSRPIRLARALSRIFQILRILCIVALVVLIPAMLFAWFAPGSVPADSKLTVAGVPVTADHPILAGTLILFANAFLIAAILLMGKLRAMMRTVEYGTPFIPENVGRLRYVAKTMGALFVFQLVVGLIVGISDNRYVIGGDADFGLLLGALVVLVLAEVFREGVRLREENEGTI